MPRSSVADSSAAFEARALWVLRHQGNRDNDGIEWIVGH